MGFPSVTRITRKYVVSLSRLSRRCEIKDERERAREGGEREEKESPLIYIKSFDVQNRPQRTSKKKIEFLRELPS